MANEEHVERLRKGAAKWNTWRKRQTVNIDLSGLELPHHTDLRGADLSATNISNAILHFANLSNAKLSGANLEGANLYGVDMEGTDLRDANLDFANLCDAHLIRANLSGADLTSARLQYANLTRANLHGIALWDADLSEADLRHADATCSKLQGAILRGAILHGANLTEAELSDTIFSNLDLSGVIGLETCIHTGPSTIDHRTLQKSGSLPLAFLRGVGLPDSLIENLPSFFDPAIQYFSCFISYSSKDQEFAERIHADLQNNGVRCWFAPHNLPIGAKILDGLDAAIRLHEKVLLILSEHSIASDWVEDEVKKAFEEERTRKPKQTVLFPIRLDDAVMETKEAWAGLLRRDRNIGDFRRWKDHDAYKASFERVLRDLKRLSN